MNKNFVDATLLNAALNISSFVTDIGYDGVEVSRLAELDGDGRWGFLLTRNGRTCSLEMPGLQIDKVRYTSDDRQSCLDFPRLYVEGGSWLWVYAVSCARDYLAPEYSNFQEDDEMVLDPFDTVLLTDEVLMLMDAEREMVLTYTTELDMLGGGDLVIIANDRCGDAANLLAESVWCYDDPLPVESEEFAYIMDEFPAW